MDKNYNKIPLRLDDVGEFLAKFTENSDHVYWISSPDFKKIQYISPSFERVWGRERKVLYDNPEIWVTFLHPDDAKKHHPIHDMANSILLLGDKARYSENYRILRPNGEIRWIMDNGFPLYDDQGQCYGVTGIAIDVTEQKMIEEQLRLAKEKAEFANRAKDEFLANMSHDIRTPLTGIIGISALLEQEVEKPEEKEHAHWVNVSGEQLLNLLNSVLDIVSVGDIKKNYVTKATVNIHQLLRAITELELPMIKLKNLELRTNVEFSCPELIQTDPVKLHRILLNLLGNAIKFTQKGHITISIHYDSINEKQGQLKLSVTDTGVGIAKEHQPKIFDRFYRGNPSHKGQYAGYGVGLHIVQAYVDLLNGHIELTSQVGVGTTFTVIIPVDIPENTEKSRHSSSVLKKDDGINTLIFPKEPAKHLPFILLIEDNPIALKVAASIAKQTHCQVLTATTGEDAFELVKAQHFDFIVSDIGLPGMSGIELTKAIRSWEKKVKKTATPIIGLTAHLLPESMLHCIEMGMNKVLQKPLHIETMQSLINLFIPSKKIIEEAPIEKKSPTLGLDLPETEAELFQLESYPLLDVDNGIQCLGNESLLNELLGQMINEHFPETILTLKQAYTNNDWIIIEKTTHKMKGGAVYCGTIRLKYACQYLERYQKAGHTQHLNALYLQLEKVVDETSKTIAIWLKENNRLIL